MHAGSSAAACAAVRSRAGAEPSAAPRTDATLGSATRRSERRRYVDEDADDDADVDDTHIFYHVIRGPWRRRPLVVGGWVKKDVPFLLFLDFFLELQKCPQKKRNSLFCRV
jgi:hypothetical protein